MAGIISGRGATLSFGTTSGFSPKYTSIGGFEASRESLDTTHLGTTGARTKVGGDLYDVGPFTSSFFFEPSETGGDVDIDELLFDTTNAAGQETVTVTYNDPASGTQSVSGSAHVTGFALEELAIDTLLMANITVQWNDWPTFEDAGV